MPISARIGSCAGLAGASESVAGSRRRQGNTGSTVVLAEYGPMALADTNLKVSVALYSLSLGCSIPSCLLVSAVVGLPLECYSGGGTARTGTVIRAPRWLLVLFSQGLQWQRNTSEHGRLGSGEARSAELWSVQ